MTTEVSLSEYYEKRSMLEGLLKLEFSSDIDYYEFTGVLSYIMGYGSGGIGTAAQYLSYRDNAQRFFKFLDDFDEEILPEWRERRVRLSGLVRRLAVQ